ncbi:putative phage protein (TIGR02220 family) [Lederbergia galactosidilyticus]|uniref:conserved phage C-terminal domain-containing protein n=1 Tax=Lederbergia galactosidilytica TaxID=217031 RepID=UPI001AE3D53D|nr:conserved phage C-terminal domain-containing protein [Lederbergia galactosidilytica]MBP1917214.1 putative phage protein (TIGR02220 family) [Lederbergia galactosidilytica]
MSKLLFDEHPLVILPSLAIHLGLNESIIIQQLHYWVNSNGKTREGHKWVYNTYEDWQKQFPFWSISTIRRTITKLENADYIIVSNFNKLAIDKTKWYRINYDMLKGLNSPSVQNEQSMCSKRTVGLSKMNKPLPESSTESSLIPYVEIVSYLNHAADKNYKDSTKSTRKHIRARWNDGFTLEDFKKVVDIKVTEWKNDGKMNKFLRPDTLFGTKFESYLNQDVGKKDPPGPGSPAPFSYDINAGEDWE